MTFGEWCGAVFLGFLGVVGVSFLALFSFIAMLRWPIALVAAAWLIAKAI